MKIGRNIRKMIFVIALSLFVSLFATNVNAAGFNVTRTITNVTNPVNNTFTYSVTADASNPRAVTPPANVTITMAGTPTGNTYSTTSSPLIADTVWTGLNYTEPGTYKFIVREVASSNPAIYPIDPTTYTVTIYVVNNMNASGVPDGTFTRTYMFSQKDGTGSKIDGTHEATFTSSMQASNLTISNNLKGNQANTDLYFKYKVTITNPTIASTNGVSYAVTGVDTGDIIWPREHNESGPTVHNPTAITGTGSTVTGYIYLKTNQTATIGLSGTLSQLPVGATYTIEQDATSPLDYTTTINGTSGTTTGTKTVVAAASSNNNDFINTKGIINPSDPDPYLPTGLIIRLFPFLLLLIISVIGVILIKRTKKQEEE